MQQGKERKMGVVLDRDFLDPAAGREQLGSLLDTAHATDPVFLPFSLASVRLIFFHAPICASAKAHSDSYFTTIEKRITW